MSGKVKRTKASSKKYGANRNETAIKHKKDIHNFKQSKDIHEDRSTVQTKFSPRRGKL